MLESVEIYSLRHGNMGELVVMWSGFEDVIELGIDFQFIPVWGHA